MTGLEAFKDVLYILSAVSHNEIDTNCETIKTIEKSLNALEIIKRFIWVEDDKLMCGRYGDVEIELDESDFEDDEEELDLLKEVLE